MVLVVVAVEDPPVLELVVVESSDEPPVLSSNSSDPLLKEFPLQAASTKASMVVIRVLDILCLTHYYARVLIFSTTI